jgi:hypothetical protein
VERKHEDVDEGRTRKSSSFSLSSLHTCLLLSIHSLPPSPSTPTTTALPRCPLLPRQKASPLPASTRHSRSHPLSLPLLLPAPTTAALPRCPPPPRRKASRHPASTRHSHSHPLSLPLSLPAPAHLQLFLVARCRRGGKQAVIRCRPTRGSQAHPQHPHEASQGVYPGPLFGELLRPLGGVRVNWVNEWEDGWHGTQLWLKA